MSSSDMPSPESVSLLRLIRANWLCQAVYVVAKLGIPDLVMQGSSTPELLSAATGYSSNALYRVMRALAGEGVFVEHGEQRFSLGSLGERLTSDHPESMRHAAIMYGEEIYQMWGDFLEVVKDEKPGWQKRFGRPYFDFLESKPESLSTFQKAMGQLGRSFYSDAALVGAFDIRDAALIVDVGGGNGSLLLKILESFPSCSGVLFDREEVAAQAKAASLSSEAESRMSVSSGDFFKSVPSGGDLYLMKRILHDWPDDKATQILRTCRSAMKAASRLFIIESILPGPNVQSPAYLLDLHMMTILGGKERRLPEFVTLLEGSSFRFERVLLPDHSINIIEASPV